MNSSQLSEAITAMDRAYSYILINVTPGKAGKVDAMAALASASRHLSYEFPQTETTVEQTEITVSLKAA